LVLEDFSNSLDENNIGIPTKHLFLPSEKFWWEIRSKNNEKSYFIDYKVEFCSCKGYYFNYKRNEGCYHLGKTKEHAGSLDYRTITHQDEDFSDFAKNIVINAINQLRRSSNI
jgi:predicted nucleic acid-binding Zn finger protein